MIVIDGTSHQSTSHSLSLAMQTGICFMLCLLATHTVHIHTHRSLRAGLSVSCSMGLGVANKLLPGTSCGGAESPNKGPSQAPRARRRLGLGCTFRVTILAAGGTWGGAPGAAQPWPSQKDVLHEIWQMLRGFVLLPRFLSAMS